MEKVRAKFRCTKITDFGYNKEFKQKKACSKNTSI